MKKKVFGIVLIIALIAGSAWWKNSQSTSNIPQGIAASNGRLTINRLDVASLYAGRVEELLVQEGQRVEKDQALARLSSTQIQSRVEATRAQIQSAEAQVEQAKARKIQADEAVSRANAQIASQQQQLTVAKLEWDNAKKLRKDNLVSASEVERRQANYKAAVAAVETAKAAKAEAQAAVKQATATVEQALAVVQQARADSAAMQSQNDDMLIKSPKAGRVEYKLADVGNVIGAGGKVVSILDLDDVYINLFLPSYQSNLVRIGDEARIKIDGLDAVFPAKITFVAANAQFTPKSVETTEERTKLMFKVKLSVPQEIIAQYPTLFKGGVTAMGYVKFDSQAQWGNALEVKLPQ